MVSCVAKGSPHASASSDPSIASLPSRWHQHRLISCHSGDASSSASQTATPAVDVSVILPVHNGERWIDGCLESVLAQSVLCEPSRAGSPSVTLQLSAFDDGSTDGTWSVLQRWVPRLEAAGVHVVLGRSGATTGGGCGFAKNRAVAQSSGAWLCFQDVDDVMRPQRIARQLCEARRHADAIVGSRVEREPEGSTVRYTAWANGMSERELVLHRFRECTLLMPTWFMARSTFYAGGGGGKDGVSGGFREEKCEDMLFLQAHVLRGGALRRVDGEPLVVYRYHADAASHAIPRRTILRHRVEAIEAAVLSPKARDGDGWRSFTIWGAGRDGREFFKALTPATRARVAAFCDVDPTKVGTDYQFYEWRVPVVHFRDATPPFVTCVALDRTHGAFEANLASLGLTEGVDYFYFC